MIPAVTHQPEFGVIFLAVKKKKSETEESILLESKNLTILILPHINTSHNFLITSFDKS